MGDTTCRLLHSDFRDKLAEEITVLGKRDVFW